MDDLISRAKAIEQMNLYGSVWIEYTDDMTKEQVIAKALMESKWTLIEVVKQLPSVQPKRGKWIHHPEIGWGETWLCDQCGEKTASTVMGKPRWKFCPMCGAKMEVTT